MKQYLFILLTPLLVLGFASCHEGKRVPAGLVAGSHMPAIRPPIPSSLVERFSQDAPYEFLQTAVLQKVENQDDVFHKSNQSCRVPVALGKVRVEKVREDFLSVDLCADRPEFQSNRCDEIPEGFYNSFCYPVRPDLEVYTVESERFAGFYGPPFILLNAWNRKTGKPSDYSIQFYGHCLLGGMGVPHLYLDANFEKTGIMRVVSDAQYSGQEGKLESILVLRAEKGNLAPLACKTFGMASTDDWRAYHLDMPARHKSGSIEERFKELGFEKVGNVYSNLKHWTKEGPLD